MLKLGIFFSFKSFLELTILLLKTSSSSSSVYIKSDSIIELNELEISNNN